MKISFSTLGCPAWEWADILAMAKDLGFDGIEVRGVASELYAPMANPFLSANRSKTKEILKQKEIEISCLTSAAYIYDKENIQKYMKEAVEYIALAQDMGIKYIRVLGDAQPYAGDNIDISFVADNLKELSYYAEGRNVDVLVETNGVFAKSETMLDLIQKVDRDNIGIIWDVHHPYRYFNEKPEYTFDMLKKYIKHIHIKDSIVNDDKVQYKMVGYGDLPLKQILKMLSEENYTGHVSLEWTKRWNPELEAPAIAFPHFINFIKDNI